MRSRGRAFASLVGLGLGVVLSVWIYAPAHEPVLAPPSTRAEPTQAPFARPLVSASIAFEPPALALPVGIVDVDLAFMPDRYLNDPPPATFRVPVMVRGRAGVAAADGGAAVMWTEGARTYFLSSYARDLAELIAIAGALR